MLGVIYECEQEPLAIATYVAQPLYVCGVARTSHGRSLGVFGQPRLAEGAQCSVFGTGVLASWMHLVACRGYRFGPVGVRSDWHVCVCGGEMAAPDVRSGAVGKVGQARPDPVGTRIPTAS